MTTGSFWRIVFFIYLAFLILAVWFSQYSSVVMGDKWNWGEFMFLMTILYTIASLRSIGPSDIGVRLFFGKPVGDQVGPGLTLVPLGFFTLRIFSNLMQQAELPAEPELIYRGTEKDKDGKEVPRGMFPPIRITFDPEKSEISEENPYDQRMTVEVTPVIRYRIVNAVEFIKTIGSWDEARRQIEDAVTSMLNEQLSKTTPSKALKGLKKINEDLDTEVDKLVKSWGIELESARLKPFGFSHDLNKAVVEIPMAQQQKIKTIIGAQATRESLILEGQGKGAAEQAVLDARAAGLKKMTDTLGVPGHVVLGAETARAITQNPGQKTVVLGSGGFSELVGIATAVGEAMKSNTPTTGGNQS